MQWWMPAVVIASYVFSQPQFYYCQVYWDHIYETSDFLWRQIVDHQPVTQKQLSSCAQLSQICRMESEYFCQSLWPNILWILHTACKDWWRRNPGFCQHHILFLVIHNCVVLYGENPRRCMINRLRTTVWCCRLLTSTVNVGGNQKCSLQHLQTIEQLLNHHCCCHLQEQRLQWRLPTKCPLLPSLSPPSV